jgi:plastocyanin
MTDPKHAISNRRRIRPRPRSWRAAPWQAMAAGAVAILLLGACSSSARPASAPSSATSSPSQATTGASSPSAAPPSSAVPVLTISGFAFHPDHLTVTPGEKIKVTNQDAAPHTVTAKAGAALFSTGNLSQGQSATIVAPSRPGDYPFYCQVHVFMTGTLTVS